MTIVSNNYGGNTNPTEFSERLEKAKHFFERQYKKEGNRKHPFQIKADRNEQLRKPMNYSSEEQIPEEQVTTRKRQASGMEESERIDGGIQTLQ